MRNSDRGVGLVLLHWLIMSAVLVGCESRRTARIDGMEHYDAVVMSHAANLLLYQHDDMTLAVLRNPWDTTKVLRRYLLVPRMDDVPDDVPADVTVVPVPLHRVVVYTGVHCALIAELGCIDCISGLCDGSYVLDRRFAERLSDGRFVDYGDAMNPSLEVIMDSQPDALMPSAFQNAGYGGVEKLNIPVIECADYMETSPLGRAEWMRFYGRLLGVGERADSLFCAVERRYEYMRDSIAAVCRERPTVMCDQLTAATWYVPGGKSTMARWISDAGGELLFDGDESGSVALNLETVFDRAHDADVWLIKYNQPRDYTYGTFSAENASYCRFAPFANRSIYGCNTGHVPFYEEAPFHPEYMLENLACIFGLGCGGRYYAPLGD